MSVAAAELPLLRIGLDSAATGGLSVGVPVLAGNTSDPLFADATPVGTQGRFALYRTGDWVLGAAAAPGSADLESETRGLYSELLSVARGQHLTRIWNYVPAINAVGPEGLENYRAFCRGRSFAFEAEFGSEFKRWLPAASAVGSQAHHLVIVFVATDRPVRYVENPRQVPAYEYPLEHGPRPPSFARASVVAHAGGLCAAFVSGTAAIRGHATVAPAAVLPQLDCTLENLREISSACGLGPDCGGGREDARHVKIYLRRADDLPVVSPILQERLLRPVDHVMYLRSDICRRTLDIEIEVSIFGVPIEF